MLKNFVSLILLLFLALFPKTTLAADFETSYQVLYELNSKEDTTVTYDVELKNLTSEYFATEYTITVDELDITKLEAFQNDAIAPVQIEKINNKTNIKVSLTKNVVGKDKTSKIKIKYHTKSLINKKGNILELNVPKLSAAESLGSYNVTIKTSPVIGKELYMYPRPTTIKKEADLNVYEFSSDKVQKNGISAVFGEFQLYELNLKYHLKNPTSKRVIQDITIPPDIKGRQNITINSIAPLPSKVYMDTDGNYLAEYLLEPSQELIINLNMEIKVTNLNHKKPLDNKESYTKENPYWEYNNETIQNIVNTLELNSLESNDQKAEKVYNYIISNFSYSTKKASIGNIDREGVVFAIKNPDQVVCMEYTDTFVSLLRASGVPAREINGYAFTSGDEDKPLSLRLDGTNDVLHAWAEYYSDELGWVQVDPTWGSTSGLDYLKQFDTNHITFVTHGENSSYPYPAGSFKVDELEDNFINVTFKSEQEYPIEYKFEAKKVLASDIKSLLTLKTHTVLKNTSNTTVYNVTLGEKKIGDLPPYGEKSITFNNPTNKIKFETFTGKQIENEIIIKDNSYTKSLVLPIITFLLSLGIFLYMIVRR